jgi:hypothetical protein
MFGFGFIGAVLQLCDVSLGKQLIIGGACYKEIACRGAIRLGLPWRRGDTQARVLLVGVPRPEANSAKRFWRLPTCTLVIQGHRTDGL